MTDVVPLAASHVPEATAMCVRAFDDYPFLHALFPGSSARRAHVSAAFYGATIRDCLRHGRVDAVMADGDVVAVAAWLRPGAYPLSLRRTAGFAPVVGQVLARYPSRAVRGVQALSRLERHHPVDPPHWYLATVAVDPDHQRHGLGRAVVRPGLDLADAHGDDAFLETAREDNAAWYHRLGFDTVVQDTCFPGGPPQWFMRRARGSGGRRSVGGDRDVS